MDAKSYLIHLVRVALLLSAFMTYVLWHIDGSLIPAALGPLIALLVILWGSKQRDALSSRPMSLPLFLIIETFLLALFVFALRILVVYDFPVWSFVVLLVLYLDFSYLLFKEYRAGLKQTGSHPA